MGFFNHVNFEFHSNDILGAEMTQQAYESSFACYLFALSSLLLYVVLPLSYIAAKI